MKGVEGMDMSGWPSEWTAYESLPLMEKGVALRGAKHVLVAQQFVREDLEVLGELATVIRRVSKSQEGARFLKGLLCDKRAMLYFAQPSSRTYLSFLAACQILGLDTMDVRDSKTSSEVKGESPEDTVRTFSSYADLIVMRHPQGGFAERVAWMLAHSNREVPVINAGSGADQHPTQALLDVYTLARSFENRGGIDGKTVLFAGDLKRGRTVRSLAWMLTLFEGVNVVFAAPEALQIGADIQVLLREAGVPFRLCDRVQEALPEADAVYMTRLQDEWDGEGEQSSLSETDFCVGVEELKLMKPEAVIMHPLPRRHEISRELDNEPQAIYWRQMRNGMWIRAALILQRFGREGLVLDSREEWA